MTKNMAIVDPNTNLVVNIVVCEDNEPETSIQIEYNDQNPAFIGGYYLDKYFYPIKPYPSWTPKDGSWVSPVPMPDGAGWEWDETNQEWFQVDFS
jgi:hypothetical protein